MQRNEFLERSTSPHLLRGSSGGPGDQGQGCSFPETANFQCRIVTMGMYEFGENLGILLEISIRMKNLERIVPGILWLYLHLRNQARYRLSTVLEKSIDGPGGGASKLAPECHVADQKDVIRDRVLRKVIIFLFGTLRVSSGTSYSSKMMISRLLRLLLADKRTVSSNDELSRLLWKVVNESVVEGHFETILAAK